MIRYLSDINFKKGWCAMNEMDFKFNLINQGKKNYIFALELPNQKDVYFQLFDLQDFKTEYFFPYY